MDENDIFIPDAQELEARIAQSKLRSGVINARKRKRTPANLSRDDVVETDTGTAYAILDRLKDSKWSGDVESGEADLFLCCPNGEDAAPYDYYLQSAKSIAESISPSIIRNEDYIPQTVDAPVKLDEKLAPKRPYVIKIYDPEMKTGIDDDVIDKIREINEANSEYVAKIIDVGSITGGKCDTSIYGRIYEVYIYYSYGCIGSLLKYRHLSEFKALVKGINEGLKVLHNKKIIHRDIKPGNILVDELRKPIITDFGVSSAILKDESETRNTSDESDKKSTSVVVSTPEFVSPEMVQGLNPDIYTDYYSLGITLYSLWYGVTPLKQLRADGKYSEYKNIHRVYFPENTDIPEELRLLIDALTYTDSHDEYTRLRWTYDKVSRWCGKDDGTLENPDDEPLTNPWDAGVAQYTAISFNRTFKNTPYVASDAYMEALLQNWDAGIEEIFMTNNAFDAFKRYDPMFARKISEVFETNYLTKDQDEKIYIQTVWLWKLAYEVCKDLKAFYWEGMRHESYEKFLSYLYTLVYTDPKGDSKGYVSTLLRGRLFSEYLNHIGSPAGLVAETEKIEKKYMKDEDVGAYAKGCELPIAAVWELLNCYENPVSFLWGGKRYESLSKFAADLAAGKVPKHIDELLRGNIVSSHIARRSGDIKAVNKIEYDYIFHDSKNKEYAGDVALLRLICELSEGVTKPVLWRGKSFASTRQLGEWIYRVIAYEHDPKPGELAGWKTHIDGLLLSRALSEYLKHNKNPAHEDIRQIENEFASLSSPIMDYRWGGPFWKMAHYLTPELRVLNWLDGSYHDLKAFGKQFKLKLSFRDKPDQWYSLLMEHRILSAHLKRLNNDSGAYMEIYSEVDEFEKRYDAAKDEAEKTTVLLDLAYYLSGDNGFAFEGEYYDTMEDFFNFLKTFGKQYKLKLSSRYEADRWSRLLMKHRILSAHLGRVNNDSGAYTEIYSKVGEFEKRYDAAKDEAEKTAVLLDLAYYLSGDKGFAFEGEYYDTMDDFISFLGTKLDISYDSLNKTFMSAISDENDGHTPAFAAWLKHNGLTAEQTRKLTNA